MRTRWTPIKTALTLALCGASLVFTAAPAGAQQQKADAAKPKSMTVLPGDDFFTYANGEWLKQTEIPADKASWGAMGQLAEETNQRIVKLIEGLASQKNLTPEERKVSDFYSAYMNENAIEQKGMAPIKSHLAKIDAIKDKAELTRALGESLRADVDALNATNFFTENLFGLWVSPALHGSPTNVGYFMQGGLGMPDRAYYLDKNQKMADLRDKYQKYIAAMFKLAGYDNPEKRAERVFSLETAIAETHATREASVDVHKADNTWAAKDFATKAPGMDWQAFFKAANLADQQKFMVWHPTAMKGEASLVGKVDLDTWKDWLAFHQLNHYAGVLPKAFVDLKFDFYGKALTGTPQQSVRWKRALSATDAAMDEAVGKIYVAKYFPPESKARVQQMVSNIITAFGKRIDKLDWMAPATRTQAKEKLKTLYVGVGYPDHWKSYEGLAVSPNDAFANAMNAEKFHYKQEIAKLHQKPDRTEWAMPPQLVNAVNLPLQNSLNFPAAILQPPFFDPKASEASNYGSIGAIIGHEISHSFDDQGSQFDAQGHMRDWWTKQDAEHFEKASQKLADQYSSYKPFPDLAVNGKQTLSENLADLAGLSASLDALHAALGPKANLEQADREFFIGYAHSWRSKMREAAERRGILTDGHAPPEYRAATVRNMDAWYKAFDVKPGEKLFLPPEQRVRVW